MNNHNRRPLLLLLIAVGILLAFGRYAPSHIGGYEVKPVNLISDITVSESADTINTQIAELQKVKEIKKEVKKDTVPAGITPIEDYSDSTEFGMEHFYKALRNRDNMNRPVRIAYFGDSFIEGDIYTADLRAMLQDKFGGNGVGFVDIASPFAGFRISLPTHSAGWDTRSSQPKDSCQRHRLGPTQRYAMPCSTAYASFSGTKHYKHLDHFETATLFLKSSHPLEITARMNKDSVINFTTRGDETIETLTCEYNLNDIRWNVSGDHTVTCYGTALEGKKGITLDNFSFRGSSGLTLTKIPQSQWNEISAVRPYDLIVLHFGLNVASKDMLKYDYYIKGLKHTINVLKQAFPHASFLIVGTSDREDRIDGELHTLPGVKALINYQQLAASQNNIAFWNLYEAMGGEGSIVKMTQTKPKGARLDYTHITREGGKTLAELLYKSLVYGYDKYIKNNNEDEYKE